mmetsp:Transcript_16039/g.27654  ORF Transcript_16039/g.27654 Transcript_16039/m.27654 type:complete len:218 (+) Transcript_16039:82-735(+)
MLFISATAPVNDVAASDARVFASDTCLRSLSSRNFRSRGVPVMPGTSSLMFEFERRFEVECAGKAGKRTKGFGKVAPPPQPVKKGGPGPARPLDPEGAKRYDDLAKEGCPEFNVYIRQKATEADEKENSWLPVGAMAVESALVASKAIYENLDGLHTGAFKLYPRLKKINIEDFEYGYQLKGDKGNPIDLAVPPAPQQPKLLDTLVTGIKGIFNKSS